MTKQVKDVLGPKNLADKALNIAGKNAKKLKSLKVKLKFKD